MKADISGSATLLKGFTAIKIVPCDAKRRRKVGGGRGPSFSTLQGRTEHQTG